MDNFVEYLYSKFLQSDGVSIDTRTLKADNLFFGISGPNFNGSSYAEEALEKGASFAVVDDKKFANDRRIILAENALKALQDLAQFHRSKYKRKLIGLTGSNGKTTTKELIKRVLENQYVVHATEGNYNNHLGVPLTLLHIIPQVEIAIIEMGASAIGEIAALCEIARPTHGLITNIGNAHTETFGGIEGVIRGKSELFDSIKKTNGEVFINTNDSVLSNMARRFENPTIFPGNNLKFIKSSPFIVYEYLGREYQTQLIGKYNYINIAAAIAVGEHFNIEEATMVEAINSYRPENLRSQYIETGTNTLILDAYNANPDSMKVALENFNEMKGKKIAIIGEMMELTDAENAHIEIGELINKLDIDEIFLVGMQTKIMQTILERAIWYKSVEDLKLHLENQIINDTSILIKGSRSTKLELLKESIIKK